MPDKYDAVVAGHLCLDILPDLSGSTAEHFHKTFAPGRLLSVGPAAYATGGAANNTGLVLHKLGIRTRIVGKVGNDIFGQAIVQIISGYGSELAGRLVVDPTTTTSYTIVISPPGDDRIFLHCPGANDGFDASDMCYEILEDARLFHFGYPPLMRRMYEDGGEQLLELYRRARQTGVTTSLDMALPDPGSDAGRADWVGILRKTLPYVDICLPSFEEMLFMLRRDTYEELVRQAGGAGILPLVTPRAPTQSEPANAGHGARGSPGSSWAIGAFICAPATGRPWSRLAAPAPGTTAWADRELWSPCFKVDVVGRRAQATPPSPASWAPCCAICRRQKPSPPRWP